MEGGSGALAEQAEMALQLAPAKMFTCSFLSHLSQTLSSDTNKAKRKCNLLKKWCLYYKEKRKKLVMIEYLRWNFLLQTIADHEATELTCIRCEHCIQFPRIKQTLLKLIIRLERQVFCRIFAGLFVVLKLIWGSFKMAETESQTMLSWKGPKRIFESDSWPCTGPSLVRISETVKTSCTGQMYNYNKFYFLTYLTRL